MKALHGLNMAHKAPQHSPQVTARQIVDNSLTSYNRTPLPVPPIHNKNFLQ